MKLQNLTVIFSIIIIPVTLILSSYIGTQIDTASLQQSYNTKLLDATHDAVVAFELNTANNSYSTNSDSIRRDILASINTFSTSLATGLGIPGANSEYILPYIPALLVTLYDGYYIYSPSEYSYRTSEKQENGEWESTSKTGYTHVLKPFVYYSAKYVSGSNYIIVNYTLDNYITLYGQIGNTPISKSGYLSTNNFLNSISNTKENLTETIKYKDSNNIIRQIDNCRFVYQNGQKIYNINGGWYTITDLSIMPYNYTGDGRDDSAIKYRDLSNRFMNYLQTPIEGVRISEIVIPKNQENGNSSSTEKILLSDPEDQTSLFNQHKRQIIRNSIQNNLNNAMAVYNANSASNGVNAYFSMPILSELDWEKIITNVNIVSFMQGLPVGTKTYNDYAIITSTNNKQYVSPDSIYFVNSGKYHTIYHLANFEGEVLSNVVGYKSQDFERVRYEVSENGTSRVEYYYRRPEYACYDCLVSSNVITTKENNTLAEVLENETIKQKYYTALARERYNLDKITKIFLEDL